MIFYVCNFNTSLHPDERVLIHSGTGGVGQAAINICKYYNCDIFVTVGNNEKKEFLIKNYNIPENRIFSSRDTQFKYEIMKVTKGKGVDIVLNSLTDEKMDASVECLAKSGRFVEIGKYELQRNKQLGMYCFLNDITIYGVELDLKISSDTKVLKKFFNWMHQNSHNGMIKPINTKIFTPDQIEDAFRYMTTGKHIGKIVIKFREEENRELEASIPDFKLNLPKKLNVLTKTYFKPSKVYIITGGLGGFGLELIQWMFQLGARKFILTSRYGVKTDYQKFILNRLKKFCENNKIFGLDIIISTLDIKTTDSTYKLIDMSRLLGEIGGVFHLAVVLNDRFLANQTSETFNETIDTKVKIFENLDEISRQLKLNLDYFVVFSSVSCGKGNAGQTNYGYGNSVCERICEDRRRDGLHGLAIQWGPIDDVGLIGDSQLKTIQTVVKQKISSCLETFDKFLQTKEAILLSVVSTYL